MVDVAGVLARWELDARQVRERMYRAPTPRERERWHARWLLAQGWSANKVAELLERDAHTIGAWLAGFVQGGPAALAFEQTGGPPRPGGRGPGGAEGGGAGRAARSRHRPGELELEGGAPVRRGPLRGSPLPQRLHALPAPARLRLQAPEAAPAQGGRGAAPRLRGRVCRPAGGSPGGRGEDLLRG
jgi:Homeodomain-like domain